jgi:hypothetical protein
MTQVNPLPTLPSSGVFPFPSAPNDLKLSEVLNGYNISTGKMTDLIGVTAWNSDGSYIVAPTNPTDFSLSIFRGRYPYNTNPQGPLPFTGANMTVPSNVISFALTLIGGGGGGGGGGGAFIVYGGGQGGGGGAGGTLVTSKLPYNSSLFAGITFISPTGGGAGAFGFGSQFGPPGSNGGLGGAGNPASVYYNGITYSAFGGGSGNPGSGGNGTNAGTSGGGTSGGGFTPNGITGSNGADGTAGNSGNGLPGTGGNNTTGQAGGAGNNIGSGGNGGAGGVPNGGNGTAGGAGAAGSMSITWYFV